MSPGLEAWQAPGLSHWHPARCTTRARYLTCMEFNVLLYTVIYTTTDILAVPISTSQPRTSPTPATVTQANGTTLYSLQAQHNPNQTTLFPKYVPSPAFAVLVKNICLTHKLRVTLPPNFPSISRHQDLLNLSQIHPLTSPPPTSSRPSSIIRTA